MRLRFKTILYISLFSNFSQEVLLLINQLSVGMRSLVSNPAMLNKFQQYHASLGPRLSEHEIVTPVQVRIIGHKDKVLEH